MLRDPRRLGAAELDPDESRLGPDALTLTFASSITRSAQRTAPIKAVLMDQARIAGLGNLLVDEALWRAASIRRAGRRHRHRRAPRALHQAIRTTLRVLDRRGGSHTGDMPRDLDVPVPPRRRAAQRRTVGGRTTYSCPVHQR